MKPLQRLRRRLLLVAVAVAGAATSQVPIYPEASAAALPVATAASVVPERDAGRMPARLMQRDAAGPDRADATHAAALSPIHPGSVATAAAAPATNSLDIWVPLALGAFLIGVILQRNSSAMVD